jgi:hypothetical protein
LVIEPTASAGRGDNRACARAKSACQGSAEAIAILIRGARQTGAL